VKINECDLPGPTRFKTSCSRCGQVVRDQREVIKKGEILCRPCAQDSYFSESREVTWPDMNWKPEQVQKVSRNKPSEIPAREAEDLCSF
ncbi:MAG: TraR/DksA C4-type zinc finger protein, partial [Desulfobacterales bacterium]|nr:TraR/DksA C4-type zinc finger protein [Desulfobacterales bacterium]